MKHSNLKALVIEDDVFKFNDIRKALEFNGITNIVHMSNQEDAWEAICKSADQNAPFGVIITDMQYPLAALMDIDTEAGFKLIERLKKEEINIPVIICSSINYRVTECLGSVWYNELSDLEFDFKELLDRL